MSAKRILFYFQPNSNRFWTRSGVVHDERAEWTYSWHGLNGKMRNPPRMEVETSWVSTSKKQISFGNKFDWVEGVTARRGGAGVETQENKKIFVPLPKKDKNKKSHERWT